MSIETENDIEQSRRNMKEFNSRYLPNTDYKEKNETLQQKYHDLLERYSKLVDKYLEV